MLYPSNVKKDFKKNITYGNRGMNLEALINDANKYYEINNLALIYKKPTPVDITKVYYNANKVHTNGLLKSKSSLDYVGIYKGKYIDFDAKSTTSKTSYPLSNISNHQIKHIEKVLYHGGISFLIIEINNEVYLFKGDDLIKFINNNERRSIPYRFICETGYLINFTYNPVLDYLKIIKEVYFKEKI